jgi:hypothetical protein
LKKNRFAPGETPGACSAKIVKRRLIWRLPGVLSESSKRPKPVPMTSWMV